MLINHTYTLRELSKKQKRTCIPYSKSTNNKMLEMSMNIINKNIRIVNNMRRMIRKKQSVDELMVWNVYREYLRVLHFDGCMWTKRIMEENGMV